MGINVADATLEPAKGEEPHVSEEVVKAKGVGPIRGFFRELARSTSGLIGFIIVVLLVAMTIFAPLLRGNLKPTTDYWAPFSAAHPLGTSGQGIDTLAMVVNGGKTVLLVGFGAAALTVLIAVVIGSLAAYFRGWFDALMLQVADLFMTIPQIVLLAVMGSLFRFDSPFWLAVIVGALSWPVLMRSIRAQVLTLKEREFVEAARLLDLGTLRIVFVEIVPNMASFILINFIIAVTNAIYAMVGLYLLGLAPLAGVNWGIMVQDGWTNGAMFNPDALPYILAPVAMIVLLQLGLILLTRSLEEILNPRLRDR
ncbi:ABC transporter permease [Aestuariimicrobium kwangyangense]|uniref:ABC transporter permease n=1 Tax=Aestuariimicrobium kwangyangense TaxID=396389 RepID=UPI0003B6EC66|nr:ABC transporter permease [Aestuariimicrobium kwangyangense]